MTEAASAAAIVTPLAAPADRSDAAAVALEARSPETRRVYRIALARLDAALAGRALSDTTLSEHVTALAADGLAPASIAQAVAAACFLARVADWPNPRGSMTGDALRIARRTIATAAAAVRRAPSPPSRFPPSSRWRSPAAARPTRQSPDCCFSPPCVDRKPPPSNGAMSRRVGKCRAPSGSGCGRARRTRTAAKPMSG